MQSEHTEITTGERITLAAVAAVSLALRTIAYFRYRFDSDEPQHLHVAWGWTQGLVQYRDLFDNHAPLFHILSAPLLKRLGERADILFYMRAPMLVLFAAVLATTWVIARRLYSPRIALWSVVLLSLYPSFFLKSIEYRTDNLWNTLCVVAVAVLVTGLPTHARLFSAGLILGIATCVSLKTPLVILSLVLAVVATRFAFVEPLMWRGAISRCAVFAAGFIIAPALMAGYFARLHALPNLFYCVFEFNGLIAQTHRHVLLLRLLYPFMLGVVIWYGRRIAVRTTIDGGAIRRDRFFLGMLLAVFVVNLAGLWVLISPRDYLPVMPLIAIFISAAIVRHAGSERRVITAMSAVAVIFILFIGHGASWFEDGTAEDITMMNQVLRLTRPGDLIMDIKGETIYRSRPYYFIFEKITRDAMRSGLLEDGVAEAVVSRRCHVAQADSPFFPERSRVFMSANFLDLGRLRASGQWIARDGSFSIAVPGEYVIVNKRGQSSGTLDGTPYTGPRELGAGPHRFDSPLRQRTACLWAPAFERGFSPFHLRDRDF